MSEELKPFDLERAKAGEPICNLAGKQLHFCGFTADGNPVVHFATDPAMTPYITHLSHLRMLPRKVKRWHVICKGGGFSDENAAYKCLRGYVERATIIEHEWEE